MPLACAAPAPVSPSAPRYRVTNATEAFFAFWRAHPDAATRTVPAFRAEVIAKYPTLYSPEVMGPYADDDHLAAYLPAVAARVPAMEHIAARLDRDLSAYDATFRAAIPDMRWAGDVYFVASLDSFDGASRKVSGTPSLFFGVDKIALLHGEKANLEPLFHHELFHFYQDSVAPDWHDAAGLLHPLWSEGLAVWVSYALSPHASLQDVVLTDEMVKDTTAALPRLAREIREALDTGTEDTYRDFFLGRGQRADVPKRCAYYVGYLVAREVAVGKTIPELARLTRDEASREVTKALRDLEEHPPSAVPPPR